MYRGRYGHIPLVASVIAAVGKSRETLSVGQCRLTPGCPRNDRLASIMKLKYDKPLSNKAKVMMFCFQTNLKYDEPLSNFALKVDLRRYVSVRMVDAVLEDIRFGLDTNPAWMHQRRVATMRLLGEMYNYKLVTSTTAGAYSPALLKESSQPELFQSLKLPNTSH